MVKNICSVDRCPRPVRAWGHCYLHYRRVKATGEPGPAIPRRYRTPAPECSVSGCVEPAKSRGWCRLHYMRWYKTGSVDLVERVPEPPKKCSMPGCVRRLASLGYCATHYMRLRKHGDPECDLRWLGDAVGYTGAHIRVKKLFGKADEHSCRHCARQARDWAYDHSDPDVRYNKETGMPYSIDPARYIPLCRACHIVFDRGVNRNDAA